MPEATDAVVADKAAPVTAIAARPWIDRLIAASVTAAAMFVLLYFPDQDDGSGAMFGALATLVAVAVGLAAAEKPRALPRRTPAMHARLAALALLLGAGLGLANLIANAGLSLLDPAIHGQMVSRWSAFSTWSVVLAEPVLEEILFRLMLMSLVGWVAARFTNDRRIIFAVALGVSSLVFGAMHMFYGGVDAPLYQLGIAVKTTALSLVLGWIFWRWGLPYAIASHCLANAVHLLLWPMVF